MICNHLHPAIIYSCDVCHALPNKGIKSLTIKAMIMNLQRKAFASLAWQNGTECSCNFLFFENKWSKVLYNIPHAYMMPTLCKPNAVADNGHLFCCGNSITFLKLWVQKQCLLALPKCEWPSVWESNRMKLKILLFISRRFAMLTAVG